MSPNAIDRRSDAGRALLVPATDDIVVLGLSGEFNSRNAGEITRLSGEQLSAGLHLIIDLSDATFIDSHVIRALIDVAAQARRRERIAVLELGTAAIVERLLEVVHIERIMPRATNRSDAIRAIRHLESSHED